MRCGLLAYTLDFELCAAGFSQGSAVTLLLLADLAKHAPHLFPQFCILVRFASNSRALAPYLDHAAQHAHASGAQSTRIVCWCT